MALRKQCDQCAKRPHALLAASDVPLRRQHAPPISLYVEPIRDRWLSLPHHALPSLTPAQESAPLALKSTAAAAVGTALSTQPGDAWRTFITSPTVLASVVLVAARLYSVHVYTLAGGGGVRKGQVTPGTHHAAHALVRRGLAAGGSATRHGSRRGRHAGNRPSKRLTNCCLHDRTLSALV
jgi:hypothetical protein